MSKLGKLTIAPHVLGLSEREFDKWFKTFAAKGYKKEDYYTPKAVKKPTGDK